MTLTVWGRGLLIWGVIAALLSSAPALLLSQLPPVWGDGFVGLVAALMSLTVTPLAIVVAGVGAIVLLVAAVRRGRS